MMPDLQDNPFDRTSGEPRFHGVRVIHRDIDIESEVYRVAALKDAADLLELPEFERRFIQEDIAPYGLELWPAAIMLAEHISRGEEGQDRPAIELGCGLGLVAVVATRCGWRVTATDNDEDALRFARYTALLNESSIGAFEVLNWNDPRVGKRFSRVFAADVLYQLVDHEPLLVCIDALLADDGEALVSDPHRGVADRFAGLALAKGFVVDVLSTSVTMDDGTAVGGRIFRMSR